MLSLMGVELYKYARAFWTVLGLLIQFQNSLPLLTGSGGEHPVPPLCGFPI
jgi:hypothetical protein